MKKLNQRGVAALEFCLVAVPLFTLMFAIFDLGRYVLTVQSLRMLARAAMLSCYTDVIMNNKSPSVCTGDPLSVTSKQNIAPFLYAGGLTPTLSIALAPIAPPLPAKSTLVITTSEPGFRMLMPIWGSTFDNPTASTSISF
jgi:TadE-like protein